MKTRRSIVGKSIRNSRYPDQGNEATGRMILHFSEGEATKKSAELPSAGVPPDCEMSYGRRAAAINTRLGVWPLHVGDPAFEFHFVGFRVASIPEPGRLTLRIARLKMLLLRRRTT
jgi:hypothetical protein